MLPDVPAMRTSHVENTGRPGGELSTERLAAAADLGSQCTRFIRLVRKIGASFTFQRNDGIESAAYAVLACAVMGGPQRLTALAEAVHADPSTVSRQTAALVRHGLLERRADPDDGRATLLVATAQGRQVFEENKEMRSRMLAAALGEWSVTDLAALTVLLDRFNTDLEGGVDMFFRAASESRAPGHPG